MVDNTAHGGCGRNEFAASPLMAIAKVALAANAVLGGHVALAQTAPSEPAPAGATATQALPAITVTGQREEIGRAHV